MNQAATIRRTPQAQGVLTRDEMVEAQDLGLVFGNAPIEETMRTRGGKYHKILEMVRRLPETSVEMGRSPHYTMFFRNAEEVKRVYAALTSTRARENRLAKRGGRKLAQVEFERRIDPDYYDATTGKKGRFTITLWNAG